MKILQLIDGRCCEAIRTFIFQQSGALTNLGEDVIILDSRGEYSTGNITLNEKELSLVSNLSSLTQFPSNVFGFAKLIARLSPDLVIAHQGESHFVAAFGILKSRRKIPLLRFRWDNRPRQGISIPAKFVSNRLTNGIAVPTRIAAAYVSRKLKPHKLEILYPAIDPNVYKPIPASNRLRDKYKISSRNLVIGMIGRLEPIRGHRSFIEAAKLVSIKYPDVRFLIAGIEGSVKLEHLKVLTDKLRISERFIFIDRVEDIRKIYSICDIGVVAVFGYEPISRILIEFMAMGIPVVGTNLNQANDILTDIGILIPPGDPVAIANALDKLIENPDLRANLIQKGLTAVSNYYTIERLGIKSQAFFREIIGGKN
jgi:glycosyltransferase involved in cell wall biosynthesis